MSRQSAPPGVATAARVHLLSEVYRGRVWWVVPDGPAMWRPRTGEDRAPVDVTGRLFELTRPGWAYVEPWDENNRPPVSPCLTTTAGEDVLMEAATAARKRKTKT